MKTVKYPADRKSNVNFIIFKLNPLMPMSPISKKKYKNGCSGSGTGT